MSLLRLGTRASLLAQTQSRWVAEQLQNAHRGLRIELVLITTSGDLRQPSPLPSPTQRAGEGDDARASSGEGGLKAMFTKELEDALLDNRIDLAVHSLKDMAAELPAGLELVSVPVREDPRDAWVSPSGIPFEKLPAGARVATGSIRRQEQLKELRPDLVIVPMRGNVDTRLRKLKEQNLDGLVLAAAGLRRLGRAEVMSGCFSVEAMIPAVGQGCLALEARAADARTRELLRAIDDGPSHAAALAERAFLATLGGDCHTPLAAHARVEAGHLEMTGWVFSQDGNSYRAARKEALRDPQAAGEALARQLLDDGAKI